MLSRPVKFYMLEKLGVPGAVHLIAVAPVEHKFRYLSPGKINVDIGQFEDVVDIPAGLPVLGNSARFSVMLQG